MNAIADTGFLVAFANRHDRHHEWAVGLAEQISEPLLTCEAVLAETAFHLQSVATVLAMVREGLVEVAFDCSDHWPQLEALAVRYGNRHPDLADLCLVRLSEASSTAQRGDRGPRGLQDLPTQQARDDPPSSVRPRCNAPNVRVGRNQA